MESDIFISYSRKDTAVVNQFVNKLTEAGYSVWIDREGIYSGDQFKAKIVKAIRDSSIVLYFSSANSNASEWTVKEISYSLKKGKTIIPIRLDDTEYEDSIDFDLMNIDFIQSDPNQPSACIGRLITSLAAHGCKRSRNQGTGISDAIPQQEMTLEELASLGEEHYNNGEYEQALECFRKAAEQGNASAQNNLGTCYFWGHGVEKDELQGVYWLRKAVEQGNATAHLNLYYCYSNGGNVVQKDEQQAIYWLRKAAEQGNAEAQFRLGVYHINKGTEKDDEQAVYWYKKAAEQGNVAAQVDLAVCYEEGVGAPQDIQYAVFWYRKAAEQGNEDAIDALKLLNAM